MGDRSLIEWCDATWNPITGCIPVSAGCANCYAKRTAERFGHGNIHGRSAGDSPPVLAPFSQIVFHPDRLDIPLRWRKPKRIFVCSMGDLFHEDVPIMDIYNVFTVMASCPRHTFLLLTKRPERMLDFCGCIRYITPKDLPHLTVPGCSYSPNGPVDDPRPLPNVWAGTTVENHEVMEDRIYDLLKTPAVKHFVSFEPLLGPVHVPKYFFSGPLGAGCKGFIDWCIVGGESGPGARTLHPDWPRSLRDQCQAAGVPFFFKQWGEWVGGDCSSHPVTVTDVRVNGKPAREIRDYGDGRFAVRVGKKAAGCLLDGKEWKEFPR